MLLVTNIMADPDIYWYWIYTANNGGIYVNWIYVMVLGTHCQQLGDICMSVGIWFLSLRNVHSVIYMHWYWIYNPNNWGIYASWIYVLVFDIYCQQLGDIC